MRIAVNSLNARIFLCCIFLAVTPQVAFAGPTWEYGIVAIHTTITKGLQKGLKDRYEIIVRLDSDKGNEFYCRESIDLQSSSVDTNALWWKCVGKLASVTPQYSAKDAPGNIVEFEPLILSLFGLKGWDAYFVKDSTLNLGQISTTDTREYFVKRQFTQ